MPRQGRPVRGRPPVRQILRMCGRRRHREAVPRRAGVRPYYQEDQQVRPALQRGLWRQD